MEVTPGKWYAVTTDSSCTVTDANGKVLCTAEAGEQKYFLATTPSITLSDEGATVTKATFNCALAVLGLLGGGTDKLPAGYTRVDFLESTGTQAIDTQQRILYSWHVLCDVETIKVIYFNQTWGWRDNQQNSNSLGYWAYVSGGNVRNGFMYDLQEKVIIEDPAKLGRILVNYIGAEAKVYIGNMLETFSKKGDYNPSITAGLFTGRRINNNLYCPAYCRVFSFTADDGDGIRKINYIPALDSSGTPCMYDTVTKKPFYNDGTGQFITGIKDAAQLRAVLRKLPDRTGQDIGTLTLSIPAEANTPEMQELLDTTETQKNWELTIQERAAEVATYMLRRVRKVVWVRRVPDKNGSYVDADGERWQTEWCSAIYSPRGNDPTLHGYEPFDSVEQAVEAWGLVPYVDPNAEELLTETE